CIEEKSLPALVDKLFLRVYSRLPMASEKALFVKHLESGFATRVLPAPPKKAEKEYDPLLRVSWSNHLNAKATEIKMDLAKRAHLGDEPTPRLKPDWRERMEDALWAMVNSPEFVFVP
ncbi:MAG TPA: hypothetical protein VK968_20150, partial [Roseimicrobium sp.]|nr:hypothetical protein [Roseimicrobium sp.]